MFTLAATNTLAGDADVATNLTITVMGMELVGSTETYKVLYQGQLPLAATVLYTVPASTTAFVKTISIVNNDLASTRSFQLFINGTTSEFAITQLISIPQGGSAYYEDSVGWRVYDSFGSIATGATQFALPEYYGLNTTKAETIPRNILSETNTTVAASGTLFMQAIYLRAGMVISNIAYYGATTASATVTGCCQGIYDINRNLLATTANNTTVLAANTQRVNALTAPYTVLVSGLYYIGYFCTATTVSTLKGHTAKTATQMSGSTPIISGISTTALTTTLPALAAAITVSTALVWFSVS